MNITVVGAGVTGLVTALTLEERGHDVQVVAAATGEAITSSVAGACWFPYRAGPPDRVARWAADTRAWLTQLVGEPGVAAITGYEITHDAARPDAPAPWWAAHITVDRAPAPVTGGPPAWRYGSIAIEPARFLPWLASRLRRPIAHRAVDALDAEPGDVVVHCAGLAARRLAGDTAMIALLGQVAIVEPGAVDRAITITDERDPDALFYAIPRSRELVLGGCSLPWSGASACAWDVPSAALPIDPALTDRILAQAAALGLAIGPLVRVRAGLRPYRPEIRLERAGRIIHNYGHGGAGYTLCRGCAEAVADLL
ncbi:MAG TPA: FAD-dependent oxidoreductase [Kofleriaceae bacterium]